MARNGRRRREPARREEPRADAPAETPRRSALRENFESVILAVLFALFVRTFIAQPYKIPSGSMEDNLLIGDHLVVNKVAFGHGADASGPTFLPTRSIRRGNVVIFRPPPTPNTDESSDYIKRVIGLPGDELVIAYDPARNNVKVRVNGEPLPENWRVGHFGEPHVDPGARWTVTFADMPQDLQTRTYSLGPDEYFVMGDNRNNSLDSRFWGDSFAVSAERIRGLAWFVYWSYDVRDGDPEPEGFVNRVANYVKIALTFVTRTRWNRTFMPIR